MYKIDLHTHSKASPDGCLTIDNYCQMIDSNKLNFIAVADHNIISFAQQLQAKLGASIIVGEEVTTNDGHLIGLYLKEAIKPGLSAAETADLIHDQNGLVYVPHPFEKRTRQSLSRQVLEAITDKVDIVEVFNGRARLASSGKLAMSWALEHKKAFAASSDAHGPHGWGQTYSRIDMLPERDNLLDLLNSPSIAAGSVGLIGRLYPELNRIRKQVHHG